MVPTPFWMACRDIYCLVADMLDALFDRRHELTPPRRIVSFGVENFREIGQEFLQYFIRYGRLQPNESVLDIGCDTGRMAIPLTQYLDSAGRYTGIEITPEAVEWCRKNISSKYPNFDFLFADIANNRYNPNGKLKASQCRFSCGDDSFDFVFLTSVFTHMLPDEVQNYASEIVRLLKPNGRCFVSLFLLNDESGALIGKGSSDLNFQYELPNCWTTDRNVPEAAVAYKESFFRSVLEKSGLILNEPIQFGSWCGRENYLSYQDIVVAVKQDGCLQSIPIANKP